MWIVETLAIFGAICLVGLIVLFGFFDVDVAIAEKDEDEKNE